MSGRHLHQNEPEIFTTPVTATTAQHRNPHESGAPSVVEAQWMKRIETAHDDALFNGGDPRIGRRAVAEAIRVAPDLHENLDASKRMTQYDSELRGIAKREPLTLSGAHIAPRPERKVTPPSAPEDSSELLSAL